MGKHIAVIQGHPDPNGQHYDHALADAYIRGLEEAKIEYQRIDVALLEFPFLRNKADFEQGNTVADIENAQKIIEWADHIVIIYPLWLGSVPAYLQTFFEQVFRPGFAFEYAKNGNTGWKKHLVGKTAHIVVTMGMPAFVYRWYYWAHGLKSLKRNVLSFCGIKTIKESLIGSVEAKDSGDRENWLKKMHQAGLEGK